MRLKGESVKAIILKKNLKSLIQVLCKSGNINRWIVKILSMDRKIDYCEDIHFIPPELDPLMVLIFFFFFFEVGVVFGKLILKFKSACLPFFFFLILFYF